MGELINLDGTPARSSQEPDQEPEVQQLPPGAMVMVIPMVCPRCQAQVAMQVRPVLLHVRADGVLMAGPGEHDEIVAQAFTIGLDRPGMQCPQCTGSGLLVPSGGMPGGLPPLGPR